MGESGILICIENCVGVGWSISLKLTAFFDGGLFVLGRKASVLKGRVAGATRKRTEFTRKFLKKHILSSLLSVVLIYM